MLAQDSYDYIKIGLALRLLRNIGTNNTARHVLAVEEDLRELLDASNFIVSKASTESTAYSDLQDSLSGMDRDAKIDEALSKKIKKQFASLEDVVFAEALTKKIYVLPERRFNTAFLLAKPEKLLKEGIYEKLEEIAKLDFASACRCILFGEATAAAFHILRATESVLKSYYFHHRRQNRLDKPMWGPMTDQLRNKKRNKPPAGLLASLDMVRTQYRNPTNHPEAVYHIDSAQDLFGVCLDVIGKMADEL